MDVAKLADDICGLTEKQLETLFENLPEKVWLKIIERIDVQIDSIDIMFCQYCSGPVADKEGGIEECAFDGCEVKCCDHCHDGVFTKRAEVDPYRGGEALCNAHWRALCSHWQ